MSAFHWEAVSAILYDGSAHAEVASERVTKFLLELSDHFGIGRKRKN